MVEFITCLGEKMQKLALIATLLAVQQLFRSCAVIDVTIGGHA